MKYNITINSVINALKEVDAILEEKEKQIEKLNKKVQEQELIIQSMFFGDEVNLNKGEKSGCDCC